MQREFDIKQASKIGTLRSKPEHDAEMKLLNEKGVMTTHQKSVKLCAYVKIGIGEHVTATDSISIIIPHAVSTVKKRELEPTKPSALPKTESIVR